MSESGTNAIAGDVRQHAAVDRSDLSAALDTPVSPEGVRLCYGCHALNRCRLGVESEHMGDDGVVVSRVVCALENEGGPEVAHGGWTAGVMDELVGHALMLNNQFGVTGSLTVKFVRPVPVGWQLIGRAWAVKEEGRRVFVRATLELESSGAVVAEADAIMVRRPDSHFEQHYRWLDTQRDVSE